MKYKITNDPNYEVNQRVRQQEAEMLEQAKIKGHQRVIKKEADTYLDKVQFAIDNKKYSTLIIGKWWNKKKKIDIILGRSPDGYMKGSRSMRCTEVMQEVARCVQSKIPKWEISGYWDNPYLEPGTGNFGIIITCDVNDL